MVEFGYKVATEQYPPDELLEYTVAAEEAGFDSIGVSDHFHPWSDRGHGAFTWTWLGAAGARTRRIRLGTKVTCPILRYHPAIVAQAAATVAAMFPQRFFLGVGTGEALNETPITGEWPDYAERAARLEEAIDLIRQLWQGQPVTYEGDYYRTVEAKLYTRPAESIPIYVAAFGPNSATLAGRCGDGLLTVFGSPPAYYRDVLFTAFERGAREAGRDPGGLPRIVEMKVIFEADRERAIEAARFWAGTAFRAVFRYPIYSPREIDGYGRVVGREAIERSWIISADPAEHVARISDYVDLGFNHLIFHCPGPDQRAFIEAYGRDVLPRLRERYGEARRARAA